LLIVLSLVMGIRLLRQYSVKQRPHTLWYAVGLLLTAVAAFPDLYANLSGGHLITPLWWIYWVAASSLVGFLAVGTAYLLSPKVGKITLWSVIVLTFLLALATVMTAGPAPAVLDATTLNKTPNGWIKAPFLIQSISGAMLIFIGAVISFIKTRGLYAIWIAAGTAIFSSGGAAAGMFSFPGLFYFTQTAGIILLYFGVTQSTAPRSKPQPQQLAH
jgi:hypothetical protein